MTSLLPGRSGPHAEDHGTGVPPAAAASPAPAPTPAFDITLLAALTMPGNCSGDRLGCPAAGADCCCCCGSVAPVALPTKFAMLLIKPITTSYRLCARLQIGPG